MTETEIIVNFSRRITKSNNFSSDLPAEGASSGGLSEAVPQPKSSPDELSVKPLHDKVIFLF